MTVLTELALPPGVEAERVPSAVLADLRSGKHRDGVVNSPPAAGESALVVPAAVKLAALRLRQELATRSLLKLPQKPGEQPEVWVGRGWVWT